MTNPTLLLIKDLVKREYNQVHATTLHLKHQLSLSPEYRIQEFTEDELREQWEHMLPYDQNLATALEELEQL